MEVIKKINNNVALAVNESEEEFIVLGKGVGFKKTPYTLSDKDNIEKVFVSPKNIKMFDILNDIPMEDIYLAEEIIEAGTEILKKELNPNLILTLSDHISFALQRIRENIEIRNPLEWEVKSLYPLETKIGQLALKIVKDKTGIVLPTSEITFIALHFVNAQLDSGEMSETTKLTKVVGEILSIVKYYFKIDYDDTPYNFTRFATHIKYFIIREMNSKSFENENEEIYQIVKIKYPETIKCVQKIQKYLQDSYGWNCSNDEKLYLTLHIERLKQK
jgi:beta-glucoside operon transcriptional antiterminator